MSDGTLIMELHHGEKDESPMQFISAAQLRRYRLLEAELNALRLIVGWLCIHGASVEQVEVAAVKVSTDVDRAEHSAPAEPALS